MHFMGMFSLLWSTYILCVIFVCGDNLYQDLRCFVSLTICVNNEIKWHENHEDDDYATVYDVFFQLVFLT